MNRRLALSLWLPLTMAGGTASAVEPLRFGQVRLGFGVGGTIAIAPEDRGYFNTIDYGLDALRLARVSLSADLRVAEHVAALAEVRTDNFETLGVYGAYLRFRPWTKRSFDVQAGLVPPVFGGFTRHPYGAGNLLIGYPLAYQYLTSLRADAVPASADDLARWRGGGWLVSYPIGNPSPHSGLVLVNTQSWDTGVEFRLGSSPVEAAAAVTLGSLSAPLEWEDDNGGKQVAVRVVWKPTPGLVVGVSGAGGEYLSRTVVDALPPDQAGRRYRQWAGGLDVEYSRGYWLLRAEAIASAWDMPALGTPPVPSRLSALALMAEGRYRLAPGWSVAARVDHLGFSQMETSHGRVTWDAPVERVEAAVSYSPERHVQVRAGYQYNWRDGGRVREEGFAVAQLLVWF